MTHVTEKMRALRERGFILGKRDMRLNQNHSGAFMVREPFDNDPWCIVGDDLTDLVNEAYETWIENR